MTFVELLAGIRKRIGGGAPSFKRRPPPEPVRLKASKPFDPTVLQRDSVEWQVWEQWIAQRSVDVSLTWPVFIADLHRTNQQLDWEISVHEAELANLQSRPRFIP